APDGVRRKRTVPSSASRTAIRFETACWLTQRRAAACWNWPSSATATNARTASMFTGWFYNSRLCSPSRLLFDPAESYRCNERVHIRRWSRRSLGRQFGWLWAAYAVSAYGKGIGFGAFPLIAIRVLHSGPVEVSALSAAGLAVGAVVAVPLGPWVEFRRKRPVMMAMDLTRFAALMT